MMNDARFGAGADRPHMNDRGAGRREYRTATLEILLGASHHIKQSLCRGALAPAADRGVDNADTLLLADFVELDRGLRLDRAVNGDDRALFGAGENAAVAQDHGAHLRVVLE